jgi:hypothetical protein
VQSFFRSLLHVRDSTLPVSVFLARMTSRARFMSIRVTRHVLFITHLPGVK